MAQESGATKAVACFVCGKNDPDKCVPMNNHKLKYSKCEILEKLGNVVGNNLLVVCCKGDIICQHCVSVMEVIDKLENELTSAKRIILRLLENKYNLKSKYDSLEEEEKECEELEAEPVTEVKETLFATRKRVSQQTIEELANTLDDPRERVWLECDKCHYTTNYTTFIQRHVRPAPCENCGNLVQDGLCSVCANGEVDGEKYDATVQPTSPMSPSTFLDDEAVLGQIAEGSTLDASQISLPETEEVDDETGKALTYLEFVEATENDVKSEEFDVSGELESGDIWEEET